MASTCYRIYRRNFIDLDKISAQTASSAQANFPITNINEKQRRSKVWRSNGFFDVTSSNNTLIFEETAATPLTATIAVAEYTSIAAMSSAIDAALTAAGASNYTVLNDSTTNFKFRITSDGAGGGGILNLLMANASNTCEDLLGFDSVDLSGALTYDSDFLRINSNESILWDMGISTNPQGFALIGPRNRPLGVSIDSTIKLQANITNNFSSPAFETTLTYNSKALLVENEDGLADQNYRYWRLLFDDQNSNGFVEVGSVLLGNFIDPARGRAQFPFESSYTDRSTTIFAEGGESFSDIREHSQNFSIRWLGLQKEDTDELDLLFENFQTAIPFFVSMDADAVFTTSSNRNLRFVKFSSPPSYRLLSPNNFAYTMNFREEL